MRIVHYISSLKENDLLSTYLKSLTQAMGGKADITIVTSNKRKELLRQPLPDILHIHTCWDYTTARLAQRMGRRGTAIVLSPHGALDAYVLSHEQPTTKLLCRYLFQRAMIRHTDALVVTTEDERSELLSFQWQSRISIVKNALLDRHTTVANMVDEMLHFYQKVIDTRYAVLMSKKEKEAIGLLVREGATNDTFSQPIDTTQRHLIDSMNDAQWRRVLLYADDEDVRDLVDRAISRLHLTIPPIDTDAIDRFPNRHPKAVGLLAGTSNDSRLQRDTTDNERSLRVICSMLLSAQQHLKSGTLSMHHMADLYSHLKYDDYDEDRLREITSELGIRRFTQAIVQLLVENLKLEEGFRPMQPHNGRTARRLRHLLEKT